jgi:hypothetical protein
LKRIHLKKNNDRLVICAIILAAITVSMLTQSSNQSFPMARASTLDSQSFFPSVADPNAEGGNFSIFWITDTQYLSQNYPRYYDSLCRWIVNNAEKYNCKMVIHTGDLVDTEGNQTQWENANNSMSILLNAGIPYCWNAGNHDYNATCWIGNQFGAFNPSNFAEKPYWIGDDSEGQNTAVHFTVSGSDFLIVNLEFNATNTTLAWANSLLDKYPDSHAIVAAHFYVNRTGGYEFWAANFKRSVLATHPNVFLTLSAHVYPLASSGIRTQVGNRAELVFNRQDKDSEMGAACVRILTFDTTQGVIDVKTYVIYANTFLTDANSQFTLNTTFWNAGAQNENENVPEFPSLIAPVFLLALATVALAVLGKRRKGSKIKA